MTTAAPARRTWRFEFTNPATAFAASPAARTIAGVTYPAAPAFRVEFTTPAGVDFVSQSLVRSIAEEMASDLRFNRYQNVAVVPA